MRALEAYSKRELTYDSDILRAMDGVFGYYAQVEPSVEQYWGLPLRWLGCKLSYKEYPTAALKHDDVVGAFLCAMLWQPRRRGVQIIKTGFEKRNGFPTWSWCGWKVQVTWTGMANTRHLKWGFKAPVFVETTTGGLIELNDEFARSLASGQSYTSLGVTCILRITTKVFDLPFIECALYRATPALEENDSFPARRGGQHWVKKDEGPGGGNLTHFVVQKNIGTSDRGLVWYLDLTKGGATTSSDLSFDTDTVNLNSMTLRCIVISYDRGMIVQSSNGISKRVGMLRFKGDFFENGRLRRNKNGNYDFDVSWPWADSVESMDLRDYFTGVVQTVRLG
jgi:hypothetical protein